MSTRSRFCRLRSVFTATAVIAVLTATLALAASPANAATTPDTIVNPSFETGDYTGWTLWESRGGTTPQCGTWGTAQTGETVNPGDQKFDYYDGVNVSQNSPGYPHTFTAADGNWTAFQAQSCSEQHRMWQDVELQSCSTLSFVLEYDNHNGSFDANRQYIALSVRDTSDVVLSTLFKTTQGVDPLVLPPTTLSFDISAFQGQTIRIDLDLQVQVWFFDAFTIDDFRLSDCNEPPTADAGGPYLVAVNEDVAFDGSASSDPDGDTLTETWTADGGTVAGATYTAGTVPGIYDVCLTVNDGTVDSGQSCTIVVVYDAAGGFVTGGGWIDSPAGAFTDDPLASGKANFGFVAKYKKGANVPDGNTEFQFKAGDLNFHSTSYEWLVVAGNTAKFKGEGTINGEGSFTFMISADDDSPDTFRIQIWGGTGTVYDNGSQQALGGGSIKVHKG